MANASLDIAFHDTVFLFINVMLFSITLAPANNDNGLYSFKSNVLDNSLKNKDEQIKMFWVGLMDGDGSIQVNHWRKSSLQYRLVIKLSNLESNHRMLVEIAKVVGGSVRITGKDQDVIWVVNNRETIKEILEIFDVYPLLTSRKICQLRFLKECLRRGSVDWYLLNRNDKYNDQPSIINSNMFGTSNSQDAYNPQDATQEKNIFILPEYFKGWLSGFVEAEGCFSIRKNNNHSFSIGQADDIYLIKAIKKFLGATNTVRNPSANFYFLEIYKKETLKNIIDHFEHYPLLGEKAESFHKWKQKF